MNCDDHTTDALPYLLAGGRQSGKNEAMRRDLARLKPGTHVVLGPGGFRREIDVQGDAVVVGSRPLQAKSGPKPIP